VWCTRLTTICQSVGISTVYNNAASKCAAQGKCWYDFIAWRRTAWLRKDKTHREH